MRHGLISAGKPSETYGVDGTRSRGAGQGSEVACRAVAAQQPSLLEDGCAERGPVFPSDKTLPQATSYPTPVTKETPRKRKPGTNLRLSPEPRQPQDQF